MQTVKYLVSASERRSVSRAEDNFRNSALGFLNLSVDQTDKCSVSTVREPLAEPEALIPRR